MDLQRTRTRTRMRARTVRTARWARRRLPWLLLLAGIAWILILVVWIAADPTPVNQ